MPHQDVESRNTNEFSKSSGTSHFEQAQFSPRHRLNTQRNDKPSLEVQTLFPELQHPQPKSVFQSQKLDLYSPLSYGKRSEEQGKPIPAPLKLRQELSPNDGLISILLSVPSPSRARGDNGNAQLKHAGSVSSIYSKAMGVSGKSKARNSPPPFTPIELGLQRNKSTASTIKTRNRGLSDCAVARMPSTPRRSRGWWNVITSPFLNRSLSSAKSKRSIDPCMTAPLPDMNNVKEVPDEHDANGPNFLNHFYAIPTFGEAASYYRDYINDLQNKADGFFDIYADGPNDRGKAFPPRVDSKAAAVAPAVAESNDFPEDQSKDVADESPSVEAQPKGLVPQPDVKENERAIPSDLPNNGPEHDHAAFSSPETPFSASSPVLGVAHIRRFESAHSVHTKPTTEASSEHLKPKVVQARQTVVEKHVSSGAISHNAMIHDEPPTPQVLQKEQRFYEPKPRQEYVPPSAPQERSVERPKAYGPMPVEYNEVPMKRRKGGSKLFNLAAAAVLTLVIVALILAMTLTRSGDNERVQLAWVNATNFPPIQTGIATIIPDGKVWEQQCVSDANLWSCNTPSTALPVGGSIPQFRVEMRYRPEPVPNKILPSSQLNQSGAVLNPREETSPRRRIKARSFLEDLLTTAIPAPPSLADQVFLGNNTDNVMTPYQGETTPFYMSVLPSEKLPGNQTAKRLARRQNPSSPSPTTTPNIPSPGPALETLYPQLEAQPLKLFNRGQPDEHYGFYSYFDKSIFMTTSNSSTTSNDTSLSPASSSTADALCTFSQTRFLVQIWTQKLLTPQFSNTSSSANDFTKPGSFPYSTTITLDRHGGDSSAKGVYCYGLDGNKNPIKSSKWLVQEDRGAGGTLVNPAPGPFEKTQDLTSPGGGWHFGGSDGGEGGCRCVWGT